MVLLLLGWWPGSAATKNRRVTDKKQDQQSDAMPQSIPFGENANQHNNNEPSNQNHSRRRATKPHCQIL